MRRGSGAAARRKRRTSQPAISKPFLSSCMEVANAPVVRDQATVAETAQETEQTPRSGEYQLTELKNVPSRTGRTVSGEFESGEKKFPIIESSIDQQLTLRAAATTESQTRNATDEDFQLRLINAVRANPCLYDPLNQYHPNKPENTKYRLKVWNGIAEELRWQSDLSLLIDEWDRLRDLYVHRKTSQQESGSERVVLSDFLKESLQWLDEYVYEEAPQSHMSLSPSNAQDYFSEVNHDVMISGYQHASQKSTGNERLSQSDPQSGGFILLRQNPAGGPTTIRLVSAHAADGTTRVGASSLAHKSPSGPSSGILRHQRVHVVHTPTTSPQFIQKVPQEGVTVTASGSAGMVGNVKKAAETVTMVVDPASYYTNGAQKMFRLVNVADLDSSGHAPPRKRILVQKQLGSSAQQGNSNASESTLSVAGGSNTVGRSRGQLGDDILIDDGIEERTVVIEQHGSDSPLLSDSPLSQMMVSGHQAVPRGSSHSRQMQLSMGDQLRSQTRLAPSSPQQHSPSLAPGYLQSQYDADLQFQQFISQNLSVLNDDEKAIAKMHIQKILMDARFGQGTCLRIMQEEELASHTDASDPTSARDATQALDM